MNINFIVKDTVNIPKLSWNRGYINSIGNEFMLFHIQNGYFKQVRSLSPKNVLGSKRFIKIRTQLLNNPTMISRTNNHVFKEFR